MYKATICPDSFGVTFAVFFCFDLLVDVPKLPCKKEAVSGQSIPTERKSNANHRNKQKIVNIYERKPIIMKVKRDIFVFHFGRKVSAH